MTAPLQMSAISAQHPFPGLRPFAYQDHHYFFGREEQIYALYRLIDCFRFIAVVGSSGSGKSSLVRAGLLPLLDTETGEPGGRSWLWREMRPGDAPLQRLTSLLASFSSDDDPVIASGRRDRIAAQLRRSCFGISEALAETSGLSGKSLVLMIDQFEELFRYAAAVSSGEPNADEVRARDEATQFVQLLLEASRSPSNKIHVMLTMRSDFIGDCARFHGLPEAVSAAQFLVPSPTRDQLDEVIRRPVEQAGATIEPELVERLLNDCSTEMDQLPVLQHCLSRLWEAAGKAPAPTAAASGPAQKNLESSDDPVAARRLSLVHYRAIGEFANALSQHADEILADLPGPKLQAAVEQTFSALSELDKQGRAIRRALRFSQLVAETGVDEAAVRQVLDRFRADDCSFVTPPPFEVNELTATTRIDVGHEALLRRWEKVSGRGAELGWLRVEQQAGQRYRSLLAMAEGDGAVLPAHLVDERWAWWKARPRTEAWAERYGGGFESVRHLLEISRRRQTLKRGGTWALLAIAAVAAIAMFSLWQSAVQARKKAEHAQAEASLRRREALQATLTSINRIAGYLNDGTMRANGAQKFLDDAQTALEHISGNSDRSPDILEVEISLLLAVSDVRDALGDDSSALELADKAETLSEADVASFPDMPRFKFLLYSSKFRVGDQLAKNIHDQDAMKKAKDDYLAAANIAKQLASANPENPQYQHDVLVVLDKVGDIDWYAKDWQAALDQYNAGLKIAQSIAAKYPGDIATQENRIAQVFSERNAKGDHDAALAQYREALVIQTDQLNKAPDSATLISNIALTHRRIGILLRDKPDDAQSEFEAAVAARQKLVASDPGNTLWRTGLATDEGLLGDTLMQKGDWSGALDNYNAAAEIFKAVVAADPDEAGPRQHLAALDVKQGDALINRGNLMLAHPEPVKDESSRLVDEALTRYRAAVENYQTMIKAGDLRNPELFDVWIKIGNVLVRQGKYQEALDAYRSAAATAEAAAATGPLDNWRVRLAAAIDQAGDGLAHQQLAGQDGGVDASAFHQLAQKVRGESEKPAADDQSTMSAPTAKPPAQHSAARGHRERRPTVPFLPQFRPRF